MLRTYITQQCLEYSVEAIEEAIILRVGRDQTEIVACRIPKVALQVVDCANQI